MLSASSFNAFLKTLEEPPQHVKFLLATTDPRKVPVTVLSRCLQFQLKNIGRDEIARYVGDVLAAEGVEFEPDALRIIARSARGSMRDALSITDQAIAHGQGALAAADVAAMVGAAGRDETGAVMEALASGDPQRVLTVSAALADKSADFGSVLAEILETLHGMAVDQALGNARQGALSPEAVQLYYQIALVGYRDLHIGPDPKTGFEMTLLRMLAFAPDAATAARVPPAAVEPSRSAGAEPAPAAEPERPDSTPEQGRAAPPAAEPELPDSTPGQGRAAPPAAEPERPDSAPEQGSAAAPSAKPERPDSTLEQSRAAPPAESVSANDENGNGLFREWYGLVERLGLTGVERMIAEHSLLVERGGGSCRLVLDRKHESLLHGGETGVVERALSDLFGEPVRLVVDIGDPAHETPAQRSGRLARERQDAARRQLEENATVQSLIETFDGRLEDVRALDTGRAEANA